MVNLKAKKGNNYISLDSYCNLLLSSSITHTKWLPAGYREGANLRKYKATPPHLPPGAPYHKHQGAQQHRHSPHHQFPPRSVVPPPPVSRVDSPNKINLQHQSTPLARLSPSSELSQQMPRILTLQVRLVLHSLSSGNYLGGLLDLECGYASFIIK